MNHTNDLDALKRMLREISETAEESSLTQSLTNGAARLDQHYRGIVQQLISMGLLSADSTFALPTGPVPPTMAQIAIDSRMLLAMLGTTDESSAKTGLAGVIAVAPFMDSNDLALLLEQKLKEGVTCDLSMLPALAPFLPAESIGKIVRSYVTRSTPADSEEKTD